MWYILKGLYLNYKKYKYDAKIIKITKQRSKLRTKQAKYTKKYEEYVRRAKEHSNG